MPPVCDLCGGDHDRSRPHFPIQGGKWWHLTDSLYNRLVDTYGPRPFYGPYPPPSVDVATELSKALAWLTANPRRRKTKGGMERFLVNWLNRAMPRP